VPGNSRGRSARNVRLALALAAALANSACITRQIRETVYDDGKIEIILRSEKRGSKIVPLGLDQPAEIAPVRMAHILSRIDLRPGEGGERKPAIPLSNLFDMADAVSKALAEASPNQQIVVQSIRHGKSLLVFDRQFLTSLLVYMKADLLYIQISRSDWPIPKAKQRSTSVTGLPETHIGEYPLNFRLVVDPGMSLVDHQSVAVQWRDPIFRKPTRTRLTATGKIVRRTVLMESTEDTSDVEQPTVSPELSSDQLRALADLEDARRAGQLSETAYFKRRGAILRGETP
jgi:hypothetical protein